MTNVVVTSPSSSLAVTDLDYLDLNGLSETFEEVFKADA